MNSLTSQLYAFSKSATCSKANRHICNLNRRIECSFLTTGHHIATCALDYKFQVSSFLSSLKSASGRASQLGSMPQGCRGRCQPGTTNFRPFLAFVIFLLHIPEHRCDVLASSQLQTCVQSSATDIQCHQKLVLTASVGNGQTLATQTLQFQLSCVGSATGTCPCPCNHLTDSSCNCYDMEAPLSVTITKTPMWASYPIQYLQSFNYKPYEVIVRPTDRICLDGDYESNPTCGWYYVKGAKVADSQGFSCQCSTSQIFDTTFGGSNQRTRANLDCDFWSDPLDILMGKVPCSAHCLQFDPLWYSGYQLGAASLQFDITVSVSMSNSTSNSTHTEQLHLSPSAPVAVSSTQLVSTQLLGDLATYTQLPAVSNMMLMVPQPSGWTPDQILASDRSQWLLLDTSTVSLDGRDCNKVGTSFTAFRYQTDGCGRAPQVCLSNQIKDLLQTDATRIAAGKVPLYTLNRYTYGSNSTLKSFSGGPLSFALPVTSTSTSLVLMSVSADSVKFVTNNSPGSISGMELCTFDKAFCGGFEAGSSRGYLWLNVTNTGSLAADYTITVNNCSSNVLPIEARKVSLSPGVPTLIQPPFDVYVGDASTASRYCWITLYNSQGLISDRSMLKFYTNATVFDTNPTGGYNGTGDGVGEAKGAVDCSKVCSNSWDVLCFVANACWGKLGGFLGIIGGVATAIAFLAIAAKAGLLSAALSKLPCFSGDSSNSSGPAAHRNQANYPPHNNMPSSSRHYSEAHGVATKSAPIYGSEKTPTGYIYSAPATHHSRSTRASTLFRVGMRTGRASLIQAAAQLATLNHARAPTVAPPGYTLPYPLSTNVYASPQQHLQIPAYRPDAVALDGHAYVTYPRQSTTPQLPATGSQARGALANLSTLSPSRRSLLAHHNPLYDLDRTQPHRH